MRLDGSERRELLIRTHEKCQQLMGLQSALSIRLGRVLQQLTRRFPDGTTPLQRLGFDRFGDFCKDRVGVSEQTGRRYMKLADLRKFPHLWEAFIQRRINQSKALELKDYLEKHPSEEEVRVEQAERLTARELHELLQPEAEENERVVAFVARMTPDQKRWFMESIQLVRLMVGYDLSLAAAWELITADLNSRLDLPETGECVEDLPTFKRRRSRNVEEILEQRSRGWEYLAVQANPIEVLDSPLPDYHDCKTLSREAMDLMLTMHRVELALGDRLLDLHEHAAPEFANVGHFAQECLGISSSSARNLVRRAKLVNRDPLLKKRLWDARISLSKFDLVMPLIERGCDALIWTGWADRTGCREIEPWVRQLKQLSDEGLACWYERVPTDPRVQEQCPDWVRESFREGVEAMGTHWTLSVISRLAVFSGFSSWTSAAILQELVACQKLAPGTGRLSTVRLELPPETALVNRKLMAGFELGGGEELSNSAYLQQAGFMFVKYNKSVCEKALKGQKRRLMERDGHQCIAPSCERRVSLHEHHNRFKSQNGDESDENKSILCVFCHLRLLHLGFLKITGKSPNALRVERVDEVWEGTPERSWRLRRRYTGPPPKAIWENLTDLLSPPAV